MNCLRLLQDETAKTPRPTLLGRRLKDRLESAEAAEAAKEVVPPSSPAVPVPVREPIVRPSPALAQGEVEESVLPPRYCLAPRSGLHRIALPIEGEIVLGRFDPMTNVAPDVDLSYDDREKFAISRRHARIIGHDGQHEIEDMGSTNGTRVNGIKLMIGQKVLLRSGDRVALAYSEFVYVPIPEVPVSLRAAVPRAYLWGTFTGHRFSLPTWGEAVIGRSDLAIGLTPDIDLSQEGDAAQVVARRHVKIIARSGRHYVEDLGSANGTKVNGVRIRLGELRLLGPGDHLWLGGCVLAYDIELQSDRAHSG